MNQVFKLYSPGFEVRDNAAALPEHFSTSLGDFKMSLRRYTAGRSAGVEALSIMGKRAGFCLLPTRGMGIWRAWCDDIPFQWNSPVSGPTNPAFVPLWEPGGLGWLEGFDELLCRCGLESNGAPEFDDKDRLRYPLHGRIANLPAESLEVMVDPDAGTIAVTGVVRESRLFFTHLKLTSTVRMQVDADFIEVEDRVTNESNRTLGHQLLYHINVGRPVLSEGAQLLAPAYEVVPKTSAAAAAIESYPTYGPPQVGFEEQVYLMRMQHNAHRWSRVLLRSADRSTGFGLSYDTSTLPYFIQWKNTGADADGYVTGLEPATNFPNHRSFEESHGRVVQIPPGDSIQYRLNLHFLSNSERVDSFATEVESLAREKVKVETELRSEWCESAANQ